MEKIFEDVKYYEELCEKLPTVPEDLEDEIESKLKKLRKFNKSQNNGKTDEEISEEVNKRFERIKLVANSKIKMKHAKEKSFDNKTHTADEMYLGKQSFDNKTHEDYETVNHQALNEKKYFQPK